MQGKETARDDGGTIAMVDGENSLLGRWKCLARGVGRLALILYGVKPENDASKPIVILI
jgi:hypothetical protein